MKLREAIGKIEKRLPLFWAEEWDNSGLAVGDPSSDICGVALSLDATEDVVAGTAKAGCQLLITHHPIIFRAIKSIIYDSPSSKAIVCAINNGIAIYSAHTNWDSSHEGVNRCLADKIELCNIEPLVLPSLPNGAWGCGAAGSFINPVPMDKCLNLLKERWRLSSCFGYGNAVKMIKKAAIGGGSCGEMWRDALLCGSDLFITSDLSYHQRQDALNAGLNLITVDHGEMERASLPSLKALIEEETGLPVKLMDEKPLDIICCK